MSNPLHSNASPDWYTPVYILDKVRHTLGSIDIDPCSCAVANEVVRASGYFCEDMNGLEFSWTGNAFVNPPSKCSYCVGRCVCKLPKRFMAKMFHEYYEHDLDAGIYLGFNLGQLKYLEDVWYDSDHVRFVIPRKRIKFWKPNESKHNPTQDNFIMLLTSDIKIITRFDHNFSDIGSLYGPLS